MSVFDMDNHVLFILLLQVVKILGVDKAHKGKVNLLFIAGNRCLKSLGTSWQQNRDLTARLK